MMGSGLRVGVLVLVGVLVVGGCAGSSGSSDTTAVTSVLEVGAVTTVVAATVASEATLSPDEQEAAALGESLDGLVERYEGLVGRVGDAKAAWVVIDGQVWAARGSAARLPDFEGGGDWLLRKTDVVSRADLLTLLVVDAIGAQRDLEGNPVEGAPDTTGGVLNDVPAGWDDAVGAVRGEIDAVNVTEAQALLDELTARVDDFESKLLILDEDPADAESVGAQAGVLLWESTTVVGEYDAAVAAEAAAREQSNNNNNSSSGGSGNSGGSSGGGGGGSGGNSGGGGSSGGGGNSGGGGDTPTPNTTSDGNPRL